MLLIDVNVLVYTHREDAADHARYKDWLYALLNSQQAFGVSELVLSGFLRVVTHPKVFKTPSLKNDRFHDSTSQHLQSANS